MDSLGRDCRPSPSHEPFVFAVYSTAHRWCITLTFTLNARDNHDRAAVAMQCSCSSKQRARSAQPGSARLASGQLGLARLGAQMTRGPITVMEWQRAERASGPIERRTMLHLAVRKTPAKGPPWGTKHSRRGRRSGNRPSDYSPHPTPFSFYPLPHPQTPKSCRRRFGHNV